MTVVVDMRMTHTCCDVHLESFYYFLSSPGNNCLLNGLRLLASTHLASYQESRLCKMY
jgi:hypothetical protein